MTVKKNAINNDDKNYTDAEYVLYCESLEKQYKRASEDGIFEVLKVLELDGEHSDSNLVEAVNYFNKNGGLIEKDAPIDFLSAREERMVKGDGKFRPELYCMLLSIKFAEGIDKKSLFLQHSHKFAFDGE